MIITDETGANVSRERIRADVAMMEAQGFELVHERPLAELRIDDALDAEESRALVESGFLGRLCAQMCAKQEPTENWREVLRSL